MAWRKATLLRKLKSMGAPRGLRPRAVLTGPFRGIRLELDLQSDSQMYLGLYERETYRDLERLSSGARSVVDIGAGEGLFTLFGLMKTRAERVIAFEPNPRAIAKFRQNLVLNNCMENDRLEFHAEYLGEIAQPGIAAADALVGRILSPCFLKMDIEGAEATVIRGAAAGLLGLPGLNLLIETHGLSVRDECDAALKKAGYRTRYLGQSWWRRFAPELRGTEVGWLVATRSLPG